jgi:hypothetical protein
MIISGLLDDEIRVVVVIIRSRRRWEDLIEMFNTFVDVVLYGGEGSHDGGASEPVRYQTEMSQVTLDPPVEDVRGTSVAQRRTVLVQQVQQLLRCVPRVFNIQYFNNAIKILINTILINAIEIN